MTGWAPQTAEVIDHGYGGSRGGAAITGAVIHHTTSQGGPSYVAGWNSRNSHPTYHVNVHGRVTGIVNPTRRPYSTGNGVDAFAITFEVDDEEIGGDWKISDASIAAVTAVIAWHAAQSPRAGHPIEVNDPAATQSGFWVGWHKQYVNTACPGPYMIQHIPAIVTAANRGKPPVITPPPPPPSTPGKLVVDGVMGPLTLEAWQRALGVAADGVFGPISTRALQAHLGGLTVDGDFGPNTRRRLQIRLGVVADTVIGPQTIRALQTRLNAGTF